MASEFQTMGRPLNLLVIEDHDALREVTVETLSVLGFYVVGVDCAEAVTELPVNFQPDIAVIDLNLPGEDGLLLASRLRTVKPGIGIIMVSARHALVEKLAGYEHGADIYLTKPTANEELCAAVQALARRIRQPLEGEVKQEFRLDLAKRLLVTPYGVLALRTTEANVLHSLVLAPKNTLETWQLLEKLGKLVDDEGKAQLQVLVSRLRTKLFEHGVTAQAIRAERGKGYQLCLSIDLI